MSGQMTAGLGHPGKAMSPSWIRTPSQSVPTQLVRMRPSRNPNCCAPQALKGWPVAGRLLGGLRLSLTLT